MRQSAAPASDSPQADELDHGIAAGARVRAERIQRGAQPAGGARARALRDVAAEGLAEPRERAVERLDVLRAQALLRPEQRRGAVGAAERHVHVVQHAQLHAREERAGRAEIERRGRRAGPSPSRRARARPVPASIPRPPSTVADPPSATSMCRAPQAERAAQQVGEARRAVRRGSRSRRRQQRQADGLGRLDQERAVAAVADRGAARAPQRVARIDLDAPRGACRADDRERALAAVGERAGERFAAGAADALGQRVGGLEGVERAAQLVGRAHDARRAHKPRTARSRSSSEPSTRSASTSRTPSEGTAITYRPAARAEANPGGESSNATASDASTPRASQAAT